MRFLAWWCYRLLFLDLFYRPLFHDKATISRLSTTKLMEADVQEICQRWQISFVVNGGSKTSVGATGILGAADSVLWCANHVSWFDPLWVLFTRAQQNRVNDWVVVATAVNQKVFSHWEKNIIPVSSRSGIKGFSGLRFKSWLASLVEALRDADAVALNRAMPQGVIDQVYNQSDVLFFPDAGSGSWKIGLGFVLVSWLLQSKKRDFETGLKLQPVFISGVSERSLMIHVWKIWLGIPTAPLCITCKLGSVQSALKVLCDSMHQLNLIATEFDENNCWTQVAKILPDLSRDQEKQKALAKMCVSQLEHEFKTQFALR